MPPSGDQIIEAVLAFVNAPTWAESKRIVEDHRDVLFTEAADEVFVGLLAQYKDNENDVRHLEERRTLLARCRREGIDATFADLVVAEIVLAFVNAQTWTESKRIVEARRDVLLIDAADEVLGSMLEQFKDDENATRQLEDRRRLLLRCRYEGIDAAFKDRLRPPTVSHEGELGALLEELQSLTELSDMPRAVSLCRAALKLISRDRQPESWAGLQVRLGNSLVQNPHGERAQNLEEAIRHYDQALEVYARQAFPDWWAAIQNDLAIAYHQRIRGERAQNLEVAIRCYELALGVSTREAFPEQWARTQNNLAAAYSDRIREERAENMEKAIFHCEQALKVYTRDGFPEQWAATQNNLALAYSNRIRGERAQNIEWAILYYQQALEICTREALPTDWAMTQNNLANVYSGRIRGERAQNIEKAIHHYQQALEVRTRESFPTDWAMTQNNLALAYSNRIRGEGAQNIEEAIHHYQQALEVRTREAFPEQWAETQHNLAATYRQRIRGERAQNIEWAIHHYQQVLEVRTRESFPTDWAATQNSLAAAYSDRIRGERAQNIEEAIHHCQQALEVYTRDGFPEQWAETQNNLALANRQRICGERAQNIEKAIHHYQQVLKIYVREAFPERWAVTQNNLANAYSNRIRGEQAENIEEAIHHYQQALEIRTREAFPEQWARTQNNLANAYADRIRGERVENIEKAIHYYWQALKIRTAEVFPQDCRDTAYALGSLLYDEQRRFAEARTALTTAHEAIEALRGEIRREGARRNLGEQNADLYARLVHCCLLEGDEEVAFKYAVAGKGRAFVDLLATARFDLSAAGADDPKLAEDLRKAQELRRQIDDLLARLGGESSGPSSPDGTEHRSPVDMRADLRALREQHAAVWEEMAYEYPALTATQQAPDFAADEARALAGDLGATLVEYYRHADGWCTFVATPDELRHVPLPDVNDDLLRRMLRWIVRVELPAGRGDVSYRLLRRLHEALIAPLRPHLPLGGAVVLAPFSWLHLVPLGAALDPDGRYAAEDYLLAFAPSLAALRVALDQVHRASSVDRPSVERLLSVAYPGVPETKTYLKYAVPEAEAVARHFAAATALYRAAATPDAVLANARGQEVIHLGCHGTFDPEAPEQSGLVLSEGWLTVQRIITELRLDRTKLVTVAACLSGRIQVRRGEEHVGLLQAVMSAGARAVVASLWSVNDAATRALFEAFYAGVADGNSPARALADAARLVRGDPRYEHPYYWAAFQVSGLALGANGPGLAQWPDDARTRVPEMHDESMRSTRGGGPDLDAEEMVWSSQALLEQMTEEPEAVLEALDPAEQARVVAELRALAGRSTRVRDEAGLLHVADDIHRLVEETPALKALLLPKEMDVVEEQNERTYTLQVHEEATSPETEYVRVRELQIINEILETCHKTLEEKMRESLEEGSEDAP